MLRHVEMFISMTSSFVLISYVMNYIIIDVEEKSSLNLRDVTVHYIEVHVTVQWLE